MRRKLAGLIEIPAIVKEGLAEEEAYVYVIETNMIQRSFSELLPSEKAAVLVAAVDLSYLSEKEQGTVAKLYEKGEVKLDAKSAKTIRESAGDLTEKKIAGLLDGEEKKIPAAMSIKIPLEVY